MNEIQNSIELGIPSFAMHETSKGSFAMPLHVYNGKVYATDERILDVPNDGVDAEKSQLVYFKEGLAYMVSWGLRGQRDRGGSKVTQAVQDRRAAQDLLAKQELKEIKVMQVHKAQRDQLARKKTRESQDQSETKAIREMQERKARKAKRE